MFPLTRDRSRNRSAIGFRPSLILNFGQDSNDILDPRITFSRASNATLVNSAGAVAYAPHNLLTFSESFDNSVWVKNGDVTVSANTSVAPDGTTTADAISSADFSVGANYCGVVTASLPQSTYTASIYAKAGTNTALEFRVLYNGTAVDGSAFFNLSTGAFTSVNPNLTAAATSVGNGWYRISVAFTTTSTATMSLRFSGETGSGNLLLWGAQLNVGALQPYNCTTVENALGFTQEFNNAAWTKSNSTITANATAAPDGSVTADTLTDSLDGAPAAHSISPATFSYISGTSYTVSIYAKQGTLPGCTLLFPSAAFTSNITARFNLSTGVVSAVDAGVTASIVAVGNGWYRCSATATATTTASGFLQIRIATASSSFYQGNGTGTIFIWGAQLSDSASLDPYVYNPAAAFTSTAYYGPRFDYDPVTLAPRGLLIEEQRTNSIRNSVGVGAVVGNPGTAPTNWTISTATGNLTSREIVGFGTENGIAYVDVRFVASGVFVASIFPDTSTGVPALNGQTWTTSFYIKLVGGSLTNVTMQTSVIENDAAGSFLAGADSGFLVPTTAALSTQRFTQTRTNTNAATAFEWSRIRVNFSGAGDITLRIGLPQLELGAFATSVIPTTTAAATRAADVATMVGDNFATWFNATEGTVFAEASGQGGTYTALDDGTTSNRVALYYGSATDPRFFVSSAGSTSCDLSLGTIVANANSKVSGAYKLNDFAGSLNGLAAVTDTSGNTAVGMDKMKIGRNVADAGYLNGRIRRIAYFPRRLSNSELQAVTA